MERVLTVKIPEELYKLIEKIVNNSKLFKNEEEFIEFSIINTILNEIKEINLKDVLKIIEKRRKELEKVGKLLDEEEIMKIVKENRI